MQRPDYPLYSTFPPKARTEMTESPRTRFSAPETPPPAAPARKVKAGAAGLKLEKRPRGFGPAGDSLSRNGRGGRRLRGRTRGGPKTAREVETMMARL